jgi:hypothetical protein
MMLPGPRDVGGVAMQLSVSIAGIAAMVVAATLLTSAIRSARAEIILR